MKFLIDAQLPRRLVHRLREAGFEAIHTLDLPLGNRTPDTDINNADFVNSFHLQHKPHKLLLVSTGNIGNAELESLFMANIEKISDGFAQFDFIEMDRKRVVFHC